jgi:hypothetical protein
MLNDYKMPTDGLELVNTYKEYHKKYAWQNHAQICPKYSDFSYIPVCIYSYTAMDLIDALPGNSSVNTVQHATIEEAVFYVDPTDTPIDWLDSDQVICVYYRFMSIPRLYTTRAVSLSSERIGTRSTKEYKWSACEDLTSDLKNLCVQ